MNCIFTRGVNVLRFKEKITRIGEITARSTSQQPWKRI